jgi:hypothetical protein
MAWRPTSSVCVSFRPSTDLHVDTVRVLIPPSVAMPQHDNVSRSRSPEREHKRRRRLSRSPRPKPVPLSLPLNARELTRHDLRTYKPMFALYLDIQKQIDIGELEEAEIKGRWKSFVNKWYAHDSKTLDRLMWEQYTDMVGTVENSRRAGMIPQP